MISFAVIGCNSRNPEPELVDPLYQELIRLRSQAETELKEAEAALAEANAVEDAVAPQTGQIKYAEKRRVQAQERFDKSKQRASYYDSKIEIRKWKARQEYIESLDGKGEWPNQKALADFKLNLDLAGRERAWSVPARREAEGLKNPAPKKEAEADQSKKAESEK